MKIKNRTNFEKIIHMLNGQYTIEDISEAVVLENRQVKKFLDYLKEEKILETDLSFKKTFQNLNPYLEEINKFSGGRKSKILVIGFEEEASNILEVLKISKFENLEKLIIDKEEIDYRNCIDLIDSNKPEIVLCLLNSTFWDMCKSLNEYFLEKGIRCIYSFGDGILGPNVNSKEDSCLNCYIKRFEESGIIKIKKYIKPSESNSNFIIENYVMVELLKGFFKELRLTLENRPELVNKVIKIEENKNTILKVIKKEFCSHCSDKYVNKTSPPKESVIELEKKEVNYRENDLRIFNSSQTLKRAQPYIGEIGIIKKVYRSKTGKYIAVSSEPMDGELLRSIDYELCPRIVTHWGKGVSDEQKKASAIMEAFERYCGKYQGWEPEIRGSYKELKNRALDPRKFILDRSEFDNYHSDLEINWTWGYSLTSRKAILIPSVFVYLCYFDYKNSQFPHYDTNGLASGNCIEEAILHGILEVVERDAVFIVRKNRLCVPDLEIKNCNNAMILNILKHLEKEGIKYRLKNMTMDLKIPTIATFLEGFDKEGERILGHGYGTHLDPEIAVMRSLTEACQILDKNIGIDLSLFRESETKTELGDMKNLIVNDLKEGIEKCVKILDNKGYETFAVNLSKPNIIFPVVRILVPGLQPLAYLQFQRNSKRCEYLPKELGYKNYKKIPINFDYPVNVSYY